METQDILPRKLKRKIRPVAKMVVAVLTSVVMIVSATVPDYSDEATFIVAAVVAVLGAFGVYRVPNQDT